MELSEKRMGRDGGCGGELAQQRGWVKLGFNGAAMNISSG